MIPINAPAFLAHLNELPAEMVTPERRDYGGINRPPDFGRPLGAIYERTAAFPWSRPPLAGSSHSSIYNTDTNANTDAHTDADAHAHSHAYADSHTHTHAHTGAHADARSSTRADAYTTATPSTPTARRVL